MNLIEALKMLERGRRIKHKGWKTDEYIKKDVIGYRDENNRRYKFRINEYEDLYLDEWEIWKSETDILIKKGQLFDIAKYCENHSCDNCILCKKDECDGQSVITGEYQRLETILLDDCFLFDDWSDSKTDRLHELIKEKK